MGGHFGQSWFVALAFFLVDRETLPKIDSSQFNFLRPQKLIFRVTKKLGLKPRPFRTALILFNFID
jgi:hypothetical protein